MRRLLLILVPCAALSGPARAGDDEPRDAEGAPHAADDEPREAPPETIVITPRPRARGVDDLVDPDPEHADRGRALGDSAFVTVVRLDERAGESVTVADVLARSLGVSVRSLGGLGAYTSLSVRGAASGHTAVVVDGVPLSKLASATQDLGQLELGGFTHLELYRGGVPAGLGGAGLGGALALTTVVGPTPEGAGVTVSSGTGSYGARHLRARWLGGDPDAGFHLAAGYRGADGDFDYFDDGGTPLSASDDSVETRGNNGYDRADYVARGRWRDGDGELVAGARGTWQAQGLPGPTTAPAAEASLATWQQLVDLSLRQDAWLGVDDLGARAGAYASLERQRYRDPMSEIGLGAQDTRYVTAVAGGRGGLDLALGLHRFEAALDARADVFEQDDLLGEDLADSSGRRAQAGVALADEIALAGGRVAVQPALRVELLRTEPVSDRYDMEASTAPRHEAFVSPRLSARWAIASFVALKGSAGRYVRIPTLLEMFGDRGYVLGNPALAAETGWAGDAGVVIAPARALGSIDRIYFELAGFASRPRDPIVFAMQNGFVARATNLEGADTRGLELAGSARVARTLTAAAHYTYLDARHRSRAASLDGKRLPHRPAHQLYGRADLARRVGGRLVVLWGDALLTSGNYLDQANVYELPARALFGAGAKLEVPGGLAVGVEVENLGDARVEDIELSPAPRPDLERVPRALSDFYGYPLPGRALYLTAEWSH